MHFCFGMGDCAWQLRAREKVAAAERAAAIMADGEGSESEAVLPTMVRRGSVGTKMPTVS